METRGQKARSERLIEPSTRDEAAILKAFQGFEFTDPSEIEHKAAQFDQIHALVKAHAKVNETVPETVQRLLELTKIGAIAVELLKRDA